MPLALCFGGTTAGLSRYSLQTGRNLPDVVPLIWQGMVSFGGSAALDEMFGAHTSAAKGYCKAALLAELLQRQVARPWEPSQRSHGATPTTAAGRAPPGGARAFGSTKSDTAGGCETEARPGGAERAGEDPNTIPGAVEEGAAGGVAGQAGEDSDTCEGEDTCDELLVDALQHQGERSSLSGIVHGWECELDAEQRRLLREYRETIAKRHSACARL